MSKQQTAAFGPPGAEPVSVLPRDEFSVALRAVGDNPGAFGAGSTIHLRDMLGNAVSWIVETYRIDGGELVFLQRNGSAGGERFVLPKEITAALTRQRDQLTARARRRGARQAVETKRAKGKPIGNPEALAKARATRRRPRKGRS